VLSPRQASGASLTIGTGHDGDSTLLPSSLRASLPTPPAAQVVELGSLRFYRYLSVVPQGQSDVESVYALPTSAGTVTALCATRTANMRFVSTCESILATMTLTSATPLPLGMNVAYALALDAAIRKLNLTRSRASASLQSAGTAAAQAAAATALATAHEAAASAVAALSPGAAATANAALVAALRATAAGYRSLAAAAAHNDQRSYENAQASLGRASGALSAAFAQLRALGYRVS
jgi:hypothetical protein